MTKKTRIGIGVLVALVALGVLAAVLIAVIELREPNPDAVYRIEELQEDYNRAVELMAGRHPFLYGNPETFRRVAERQYRELRDGMTAGKFYRVLGPVVEALECGHSNLQMSRGYEDYLSEEPALFPLPVTVVDGELYIQETERRITAINGHPSDQILAEMLSMITSDGVNRTSKVEKINNQFAHYYHLIVDASRTFEVEYIDGETGRRATGLLDGVPRTEILSGERGHSSIGLYLDFGEMKYDFDGEIHDDYAYLSVGSFILDQGAFRDFLGDYFAEVESRGARRLVLDLRGNWGGPPRGSALLYSYLMETPGPYLDAEAPFYFFAYRRPAEAREDAFTGELVVLTDGAVFSTTAHLVSLLEERQGSEIIGERTGGSAGCTDATRKTTLPNTRLRLYYATRVFSTPAPRQSDGAGIAPDRRITPTVEDLLRGKDPVLEAALSG